MNKILGYAALGVGATFLVVLFAGGFGLVLAFPIKWTWNYAIVSTFGLPAITWGKAWCLLFLSAVLIRNTTGTSNVTKSEK